MTLRYTFREPLPWRHQLQALEKVRRLNGKALLAMPMRTGKSRVAIDWAGISYYNSDLRRVLVVSHRPGTGVWADQIRQFCPAPSRVTVLDRSARKNAETVAALAADPFDGIDWIIVHYEAVWRPIDQRTTLDRRLAGWAPHLVIGDESHKLKWPTSRQSEAMSRLGQATPMKLALTGTPVTKWALDVFGQFRFVNSDIFGIGRSAWKNFRHRYATWRPSPYAQFVEELDGYQNLDELVQRVHANSFRVRLEDCFDVPDRITQDIPVRLPPAAQAMYKEMAKEMIVEITQGVYSTASIVLTKTLRLSQLTSGFLKDTEGVEQPVHTAKLDACIELVEDMIEQDEKVVVFALFQHDYTTITEALQRRGIGVVLLKGATSADDARRFREDPQVKVLVSQIATGALGLDLSAARMCIMYSWDHRWDTYVQAIDRIYQGGKTHALGIYRLVVPNSIDGLKLRVIEGKGDLAEAIMHNPQSLLE